jgi:formylglycine-generating enzyme required for sulfatase activity
MASLVDLPELVGFFSYSREDDADSHGALSALRTRIQGELRSQLGRTAKTFRLWQDKEAIPAGTLWESEIRNAVAQSVFFIPIITPTVIASQHCQFELNSFLAREALLGRNDLVFPILYIDIPALQEAARRQNDPVLSLIAKRQYVDWREFRYHDVDATEVKKAVGGFCVHIRDALQRPSISPDERAEEEEPQREAAAEQKRAVTEPQRIEDGRFRKEGKQRPVPPPVPRPWWQRPAPIVAVAAAVIIVGAIGVWRLMVTPVPVVVSSVSPNPPQPTPVTPTPAPVTPTPPASVTPAPTLRAAKPPLSAAQESALKPRDTFQECTNCPQMIVVPAGSFTMGSPASEPGSYSDERPQHKVAIARQFAVGQFELTFDEWDACTADGSCSSHKLDDRGWGRGRRPVIDVSWIDAKGYVAWLAQKSGKPYRLLTEAEYEYATRAGTTTAYPWGGAVGTNNANCFGCGSRWDNRQTAPVGSFAPNGFGLFDMVGNVWEWTEDCYHDNYNGAPGDGSAWTTGECKNRVVRGGSWIGTPDCIRSANRYRCTVVNVGPTLGFRVARTLLTP